MARLFDDAANQFLSTGIATVTAPPFTFVTWAYVDDTAVVNPAMTLDVLADATTGWEMTTQAAPGLKVQYNGRGVGIFALATTTLITINTWHHLAASSAAANSHAVWLDGGGKSTSVVNVVAAGIDDTLLSLNRRRNGYFSGRLAESAVWNAALTDAEIAILAAGYSPLFVRPQSLVAYWPLIGRLSPEHDPVGGFDMALTNAPTQAPHPRMIYPTRQVLSFPTAAALKLLERGLWRGAARGVLRGL